MDSIDKEKLFAKKACITCGREFELDVSVCPDDGTLLTSLVDEQLVGTILNNTYEILEVIGGGGMGLVYKARHRLMNRIVAIKMLHRISSADTLKRFQLEAQAASCLSLPNILTVYDFGVTPEGQPFMVMDYLEGTSLADVLEAEGHVEIDRAISIFIQACGGLAHAHQKGVLHRDIKPSNIMLVKYGDQEDFVKIVDFGIAKLLNQGPGDLTKSGEVYGSPSYMSPEQCRGRETDARSDIYAMGCVMYRTLTGFPLFTGDDIIELLFKQVSELPAPFNKICPELNLPLDLQAVVFKAIAKDPNDRFATMSDFKEALELLKEKRSGKHSDSKGGDTPTPFWKRAGETSVDGRSAVVSDSVQGVQLASLAKKSELDAKGSLDQNKTNSDRSPAHRDSLAEKTATAGSAPQSEPLSVKADAAKSSSAARSTRLRQKMGQKSRVLIISLAVVGCIGLGAGAFLLSHQTQSATKATAPTVSRVSAVTPARVTADIKNGSAKEVYSVAADDPSELLSSGRADYNAKQYDEAYAAFNKAMPLTEKKYGHQSIEVADLLLETAKAQLAMGKASMAERSVKSSIEIREQKFGLDSRELVGALQILSDLYMETNMTGMREAALKRAIAIQEKAAGPNDLTVADLDLRSPRRFKTRKISKRLR